MKIIQTRRLYLREFELDDAQSFFNLNADPDVLKWTGDQPFVSVGEAERFLQNYSDYEKNGFGRWAVISNETSRFIGWCGLKLNEEGQVDLGFRFFKKEWGKGYATEAARKTLWYAFHSLGLEEVIGRSSINNRASIRVLEKIGMRFWKYGSCHGIDNAIYFKILNKHYQNSF